MFNAQSDTLIDDLLVAPIQKNIIEQIQLICSQGKTSDVIHAKACTSRIRVEALLGVYRRVPLIV